MLATGAMFYGGHVFALGELTAQGENVQDKEDLWAVGAPIVTETS